jgi:colanic acid/amylovoran biosynthesis glycosyltransferase
MKIGIFLNLFPAISETFILNQIVYLLDHGHEVHIHALSHPEGHKKIHSDITRYGVQERVVYSGLTPESIVARFQSAFFKISLWGWRNPMRTLNSLNIWQHGRLAASLRLVHDRLPSYPYPLEYDIIHCHFGPNGKRALSYREFGALKGPIITTFHGYDANQLPKIHGAAMYKDLFTKGDQFTVGSAFMHRKIASLGANEDRITVLPMGVDLAKFKFYARSKEQDRELRLLTVARLVEVKGIEYALLAVRALVDRGVRLRYQIAGDGFLRAKLERLSSQLCLTGIVEFLGERIQSEVIELYSANDVFLLPSIITESGEEENQSVALAEAQATGMPVVATKIGGNSETVRDGESGFLVPPRDPDAISSSILWLVEHPQEWGRIGQAGRAHIQANYDLQKLNERLLALYYSLDAKAGGVSSSRRE